MITIDELHEAITYKHLWADDSQWSFLEEGRSVGTKFNVESHGIAEIVESGADYVVFELNGQFFRKDANFGDWDGPLTEVEPFEATVTQYKALKRPELSLILLREKLRDTYGFFASLWCGEAMDAYNHNEDVKLILSTFGEPERVAQWGGGDQAQQWIVFKLGGRLWQKEGRHSSWDSDDWDGPLNEVKEVQKTVTRYEVI